MFRRKHASLEVFLVHPGGPFFVAKDLGAWGIPKGEYEPGEEPLAAAVREFREETGFEAQGALLELGSIRQAGGKVVAAWAFEGDCDPQTLVSNTCVIQWPPRSGRMLEIPEVDRGGWFSIAEASRYIKNTQQPFLERLETRLGASEDDDALV